MLNPINALLEIVLPEELFAYGEVPRLKRGLWQSPRSGRDETPEAGSCTRG